MPQALTCSPRASAEFQRQALAWRLEMAESRIATLEAEVRRLARREAA